MNSIIKLNLIFKLQSLDIVPLNVFDHQNRKKVYFKKSEVVDYFYNVKSTHKPS